MFGWFRRRREARVKEVLRLKQSLAIQQAATDRRLAYVKRADDYLQPPYHQSTYVTPPTAPLVSWYEIDAARQRREDENQAIGLATALVVESIIDSTPSYDPTPSYDSGPSYDPGPSIDYSSSFDSGSSGGAGGGSDW